jgi:glycosyltransferase involved in cell wall biosynthesis
MRIFFFTGWFPFPPDNGARIRLYNFIKQLSIRHEVFLVSLLQEDSNPENAENLNEFCHVMALHRLKPYNPKALSSFPGFFSNQPRSIFAGYNPAIKDSVQDLIKKINPEVIIASTLDVVNYLLDYLPGIPSVLIDHNCEFSVLKRSTEFIHGKLSKWRYELGWKKFAHWEAKICRLFDVVIMPTVEDKEKMLEFAPDIKNITVIPNAADTSLFDPSCWSPETGRLIYNGALTYDANLDAVNYFAEEIYPRIAQQMKGVQLVVTGRFDGVDTNQLTEDRGIKLSGYVEDIRTELYRSAACVIPLRKGGGMRLKIPEAMAAGVPVVSTSMGAEGLDCLHEEHLLMADTPSGLADAVVRVLTDRELALKLHQNGRKLIEDKYSWEISGKMFVNLVETVADQSISGS